MMRVKMKMRFETHVSTYMEKFRLCSGWLRLWSEMLTLDSSRPTISFG